LRIMRPAILLAAILLGTLPVTASDVVTVGEFIQKLALAKKVDSSAPQVALDSLDRIGIRLPTGLDLSAGLTEGDVARISRSLGLSVSTNRPQTGFSAEQVDKFLASFRVELVLNSGGNAGTRAPTPASGRFDPYTKGKGSGKGKKRGHNFQPTEPE
jgi:hypothetical protein